MIKCLGIILILLALSVGVSGQKVMRNTSILNYQRGDHILLHFGFSLGVNYMDYRLDLSGDNPYRAEGGKLTPGFLVGIISELRITEDLGLRFLPGLEFATRRMVFTNTPDGDDGRWENFNESIYVSLPLMLKYKAKRINNFCPYITAGSSFKYDFRKHKAIEPDRTIYLRTKPGDVFLETGLGCDFYLPYFKFGLELRFSLGLTDILIREHDALNPGYEGYTDALKSVRARMFTVCLNFE